MKYAIVFAALALSPALISAPAGAQAEAPDTEAIQKLKDEADRLFGRVPEAGSNIFGNAHRF